MRIHASVVLLAAVAAIAACTPRAEENEARPAWTAENGVTVGSPAPRKEGQLRVLVYHDMEGLAGQDDYRTFNYSHPEHYPKGRAFLAADVNAVVDGLFAGGATSVTIVDGHGSGNSAPDLDPALLDRRATQLTRDSAFRQYVDIVTPDTYDAIVAVGMHAKTGSQGFAAHTITIGMDVWMNGRSITESELVAYSWGRYGVPMVMVTGDDKLAADLQTMPWLKFVVTKHATSASTVQLRDVDSVHAEMKAQAAAALRDIAQAKTITVKEPVNAALRVVLPARLSPLRGVPGVTLAASGDRVDFVAKDFVAAYDGVNALIGVARLAYPTVQNEIIREHADSTLILRRQRERLMERWFDVESGRWSPPPAPAAAPGRKFYGAQ
ncbi:MAG: M55 family metallopeptidase [Gemmatimonadetes bacterium]|nr:M55 family metallopeptidase [Gemmatimonadota bacterium]